MESYDELVCLQDIKLCDSFAQVHGISVMFITISCTDFPFGLLIITDSISVIGTGLFRCLFLLM